MWFSRMALRAAPPSQPYADDRITYAKGDDAVAGGIPVRFGSELDAGIGDAVNVERRLHLEAQQQANGIPEGSEMHFV